MKNRNSVIMIGFALAVCAAPTIPAAQTTNSVQPQPTEEVEAAYTKNIEKRVADILAVLEVTDAAKSNKVHDILIAQYRALREWHDANDKKLKGATEDAARDIHASLKTLHDNFVTKLA